VTTLDTGAVFSYVRDVEICGQQLDGMAVERICSIIESEGSSSLSALSRRVCESMGWRSANGRLQEVSCRKALKQLQREGLVELPEVEGEYSFQRRSSPRLPEEFVVPELACSLKELGRVLVEPVSSRYAKASGIWNGLMERYHYLGSGPLCGAQIRYLIRTEDGRILGGLSFNSATWRLQARDDRVGWSEKARRTNLNRVVCNSRFLILPTVRVPHLASHVLALSLSRLRDDWQARYGILPVLVETFVDPKRFKGTCYRAANWIHLGQTAGRATGYSNGKVSDGKKEIFVYPLEPGVSWQKKLCSAPETALGSKPRPSSFGDWTEEEFGSLEVYDKRLKERVYTVAQDFYGQPGAMITEACNGSVAKTKAAYRLFKNEKIDMETLLKPHVEATVERIKKHQVVLAAQDTTTLDYTAHPATDGLGPICHQSDSCTGFILHDTMAFSEQGTPLGLLDIQCWARDPKTAGKKKDRAKLPIEQKESIKWLKSYRAVSEVQGLCPDTTLISVGDREADIYELFHEATQDKSGTKLLVRADRYRKRKVEQELLWDKMAASRVKGQREIYIPRSGSRKARTAKVEIRFDLVKLTPPQGKKLPPIKIWAVYVVEVEHGPEVTKPIEWMLLTTVQVSTFKQAVERMDWYAKRWGIEVYHRTIKSGCRIEDRQLGSADSLEACLAIDLVVAWRIFFLTQQSRETPEMPCDAILTEDEWKALYAFAEEKPPPQKPPSIKRAVLMIAKLGGFLGRKQDGNPGTTTIWRGLRRLDGIAIGFKVGLALAEEMNKERDGP